MTTHVERRCFKRRSLDWYVKWINQKDWWLWAPLGVTVIWLVDKLCKSQGW